MMTVYQTIPWSRVKLHCGFNKNSLHRRLYKQDVQYGVRGDVYQRAVWCAGRCLPTCSVVCRALSTTVQCVQGAVYHCAMCAGRCLPTCSVVCRALSTTGSSLAEATNLCVGQTDLTFSHLDNWYTLLRKACKQVSLAHIHS